jgi:outer membrane biosynthesis protein TonB
MAKNKLTTNTRFIGLLLGTALLSNSAAALALSNETSTAAKPKAPQTALKANDPTAPEVQPAAPKADDTTAPKGDEKPVEKTPEVQPAAPKADDTTAPKGDEKPAEKTPEVQPVAPQVDDSAAPKGEQKAPDATTPGTKQQGGTVNLSDISGNWAEPFIRVLAEKGIIAGYPDGTYQPDRPVTRAEFAALVNKAFPDAPEIQAPRTFRLLGYCGDRQSLLDRLLGW